MSTIENFKEDITEDPLLPLSTFNKEFVIKIDASEYGIGIVLM